MAGLLRWLGLGRAAIDPAYRFLLDPPLPDEAVAIDCETTGLDPRVDDIVSLAAIPILGDRLLTSQKFVATLRPEAPIRPDAIKIHQLREADVKGGRTMAEVLPEFLSFIGSRPLVGFYLEFDVAMLNKHVRRLIGANLPNANIETSSLYHQLKYAGAPPGVQIDLSFKAMLRDLNVPMLDQHDAYADALMTAMAYLQLRDMQMRGVKIPRRRPGAIAAFGAA